ncbi:MAG: tetratricopeptide repeat protein [Thermoleophilia bacterium]|nr:tetratricopeptide repeat protein [Thermoleophilia bacterium]
MNKKYLVAIAIAAVVVVALIIIIPGLGSNGSTAVTQAPSAGDGQTAPPIPSDATVPEGHPDISDSDTGSAGASVEEFVKSAEDAYDANPKDMQTLLTLGDAYLQAGRTDDAKKIFDEALTVDGSSSEAKAGRAMADFVGGDAAGAQGSLEALVQEDPKSQVALYDLAVVYFSGNEREKAQETWQKVVDIDPATDLGNMAQQFLDLMSQSGDASGDNPHATDGESTSTTTQ